MSKRKHARHRLAKARKAARSKFERSPVGSPVHSCPPPVTCKLNSVSVTCSHGRAPSDGVLEVVPDSYGSIGDQINCKGSLDGGCGKHIQWTTAGMWSSTEQGSSTNFLAKTFVPALFEGWLGLHHVSPQSYTVSASACQGDVPLVEIRAYPPDKWGGKIDFGEIHKKIEQWLDPAPIDEETKKELEHGWFIGALEYGQQWKEKKHSNLAYCETVVAGSFDPLFGFKLPPQQIYPPGLIPAELERWLKAGLYFSADGGFSLKVELMWDYRPYDDISEYEKTEVSLFGRISGKLSLNLFLVDEDVASAEVVGSTGFKAGIKLIAESSPVLELGAQWTGLDATVTIKAAWGWIEISRTYPLIKESDLWKHEWPLSKEGGG